MKNTAHFVYKAHNERVNYRWNVTARCSACGDEKGEVWAGFFPGVPDTLAESIALESAASVDLGNYCVHCGAEMKKEDEF